MCMEWEECLDKPDKKRPQQPTWIQLYTLYTHTHIHPSREERAWIKSAAQSAEWILFL